MPADGMSAAGKINRKNKRTSASPNWQLAKKLHHRPVRRNALVAECETRGLTGSPPALERRLIGSPRSGRGNLARWEWPGYE